MTMTRINASDLDGRRAASLARTRANPGLGMREALARPGNTRPCPPRSEGVKE